MHAKMARALVLSVAGAAAVAAAVVPASAATSPAWRIVKTFGPAEGGWSDNFAVSGAHDAWSTWIACNPCGINPVTQFYVEHSAGTTWRKVHVPESLKGAAEASAAIGASSYRNAWFFDPAIPSNAPHAHVLRWNGSKWHRQAIPSWAMHPNLTGSYDIVPAVFGPKSVWVFSMGVDAFTNPDHYVARYNGHSWTKLQMPAVPIQVSVLSERDIWALGYTVATKAKPSKGILMHWNGRRWSTLAVPSVHVPKNATEDVLNPVALGRADVWIERDITRGTAGATTLYLLHWNGRHWARVALPAGTSGVDYMTQDGHGGLWVAANGPKPSYSPRLYHLNRKWTRYRVPAVKGTTAGTLAGISWIPGTRSVWATGNLFQRSTNGGVIGDILKHAG